MKKRRVRAGAAPATATASGAPGRPSFPIVGIGASAGGLDAFRRLLGALPGNTGMAYVLVQHLDPKHDSILADLLSEATPMEVSEVHGDVTVEPNHVYVIPPSKGLVLTDGMLKLVPRTPAGMAHMPIDSFFRSLASAQGSQAIGVILSGMGTDGTLGLRAIEGEGGIAFAQEPSSARNADMPASAISAGGVDFVLSPEDIAVELGRLGGHPYLAQEPDPEDEDEGALAQVLALLRKSSGTDFGSYKKTTLRRRIARRMAVTRVDTLPDYASRLESDAAEAKALFADCLISVTSFFRDPKVYQVLADRVLPVLLKDRPSDVPVRVWVAGCATGEEVYSIAMCLLEASAALSRNPSLQLFATDLSDAALARAREGSYPESIAKDVSPERLRRFFAKVGHHYQISKAIREMCVFARHDMTRDPPYSRLDLITCRNVLIYLEPRLQERVFTTFHYALRPEGFLVLGPAESAGAESALFAAVDETHRVYSRKAASGPARLHAMQPAPGAAVADPVPVVPRVPAASELTREADRMLLARFGPAGVVVDEDLCILEFRGDTDPFLDHGNGKASLKLERLLRPGLLMELREAIDEVRSRDAPVRREGLHVRHRDQLLSVSVEVVPIKGRASAEKCLLVLFEKDGERPSDRRRDAAVPSSKDAFAQDQEIARLEQVLARTTDYLHTLVREHEAALEELQSTNEEALSSNEELQSVNEELQTAKEEIQSANEELATLNQELQDRNGQLARSNEEIQRALDSANGLVDTVRRPLVILDGDLRVEKANAAFYETFRLAADQALGRRLPELGTGEWRQPALLAALHEVLAEDRAIDNLEMDAEFTAIGPRSVSISARRLHPERDTRGRILLAIEDRTETRRDEQARETLLALEHTARQKAEAADKLKDEFVATVSHELRGPLTVIAGWMNLLLNATDGADPQTLKNALGAIGRAVKTQGRLISDLLDHARLATGKVELQLAPLDLFALAEAAVEGLRATAQAKGIALEVSGEHMVGIVLGDADRLQQVVWNLCFNAIKFTPADGSVRVGVGRVGNHVHLTVTDDGRGIGDDFLPHVFERFRQADGSSSRTQPGLGLGLTLVRELVELHGGTVRAQSPGPGLGATFTVVLPVPAVLLLPTTAAPGQPARRVLDRTRVLVVDDESDARDALVALLERHGAEVRPAASVAQAMAALEASLPHVVISDIGMPGEDGYELIRRMRLLPADAGGRLPSLALTAYATEDHRRKVMASGFHHYLEKPVAPAELVAEVARLAAMDGV